MFRQIFAKNVPNYCHKIAIKKLAYIKSCDILGCEKGHIMMSKNPEITLGFVFSDCITSVQS